MTFLRELTFKVIEVWVALCWYIWLHALPLPHVNPSSLQLIAMPFFQFLRSKYWELSWLLPYSLSSPPPRMGILSFLLKIYVQNLITAFTRMRHLYLSLRLWVKYVFLNGLPDSLFALLEFIFHTEARWISHYMSHFWSKLCNSSRFTPS